MFENHTIVRYTVKPGHEDHNQELVRAVYDQLGEQWPEGLAYATFRLDDGRTFVHVASWDGDFPLTGLPAFQEFRKGLDERCESGPDVRPASLVASGRPGRSPAPA